MPLPPPLFAWAEGRAAGREPEVALPAMGEGEAIAEDYASLHLSLRGHPLALLRPRLEAGRGRYPPLVPAARLRELADGVRLTTPIDLVAGTQRQLAIRPTGARWPSRRRQIVLR